MVSQVITDKTQSNLASKPEIRLRDGVGCEREIVKITGTDRWNDKEKSIDIKLQTDRCDANRASAFRVKY